MEEIITEKKYPIQKLWILKSTIRYWIIFIFIAIVFFYWSTLNNNFSLWDILLNIPSFKIYFLAYLISLPITLIVAILRRATFHYSIDPQFLTFRQGILSRQQKYVSYGVIQSVFVKQDLFDRIFKIASLSIEDASHGGSSADNYRKQKIEMVGFSGNKISIPGLTKKDAEILKGIILQKMKENPIEDSQSGL